MKKYTREAIVSTINEENGDLKKAASTLGISLRWLQKLIVNLDIKKFQKYE